MENASKALIMASGILLGIMILTIGVYIFSIFGQYSEDAYKKMEEAQIEQFNNQFLKYYGNISRTYINEETQKQETVEGPIEVSAHEIISIANLAGQNNISYGLSEMNTYNENSFYIQVDIYDKTNRPKNNDNLEKWDELKKITFIREHSNDKYKCTDAVISKNTKKICYMRFEKIYK